MKCSFDFDDTLTEEPVWRYALELMDRGVDVWVVTARLDDEHIKAEYGRYFEEHPEELTGWLDNSSLFEMCDAMKIPRDQIIFTNLEGKGTSYFNAHSDFLWHLDDSTKQLWNVKYSSSVLPINVTNPIWKAKCEQEIKAADKQHYLSEWFIKDLDTYDYGYEERGWSSNPKDVAIGWLDDKDFPKGETPPGFLEKLIKIPSIERHKGSHVCPFCHSAKSSTIYGIYANKKTYIYPGMLAHYIKTHNYLPPQEFIDIVMSGDFRIQKPKPKRPTTKRRRI